MLNAAWIFAWHYDLIWLSVLIMIGLLFTLIRIADILRASVLGKKERWMVHLPFSVYFGWITVATIANIIVFLVKINWNRFGLSENIWVVLILLTGALIGILRMHKDRHIAYGLVLIWAYLGILLKHLSADGFDGQYPNIILIIIASLIFLIFFTGKIFYKNK